jgi:hypothetical protein
VQPTNNGPVEKEYKVKSKAFLIGLMTVAVGTAVAATSFDRANVLKDELKLHHVDGKKDEAARLATKLASTGNNEPFVQGALQEELRGLDTDVTTSSLDKEVKFLTGSKTEMYCEGQGLVEMTGEHKDGSTSHLVLVRSNRKLLPDTYSDVESGDWTYELTDSYRRPSISELWMITGSPSSFHVKEVRNRPNGKADSGDFSSSWTPTKTSASFGSQGEGAEPVHTYMALDFHLWGNTDLGYKIKFEPGTEQSQEWSYTGSTKNIHIESVRTVGEKLALYKVKDSQSTEHEFKSCFPVTYQISLKKLEDRQLEVEGKINLKRVRSVIKSNRQLALDCYSKARELDSTISGTVTLAWEVGDDGGTTNVKQSGRSLTGDGNFSARDEMIQCLVDSVKTWKFPMAAEGTTAKIAYPFTFKK